MLRGWLARRAGVAGLLLGVFDKCCLGAAILPGRASPTWARCPF